VLRNDWPFVLQPLAFRAVNQRHHPMPIARLAVLPSEAEFCAVAGKVLLGKLVEDAVMAALE
jgi:hypothetical protein